MASAGQSGGKGAAGRQEGTMASQLDIESREEHKKVMAAPGAEAYGKT
jgi:hypothetical protein